MNNFQSNKKLKLNIKVSPYVFICYLDKVAQNFNEIYYT